MITQWVDPDGLRTYATPMGEFRSVTSVLKLVAKPAFVPKAVKITAEWFKEKLIDIRDGRIPLAELDLDEFIKLGKSQYKDLWEGKANDGSEFHHIIYQYRTQGIERPDHPLWNTFIQRDKDFNVRVLNTELVVYSAKQYAGTADEIAKINYHVKRGRPRKGLYLNDFKTGGLYDEVILQIAPYVFAYEEMTGQKLDGGMATQIRADGYEVKMFDKPQLREAMKRFMCLLKFVLLNDKLKKKCKNNLQNLTNEAV